MKKAQDEVKMVEAALEVSETPKKRGRPAKAVTKAAIQAYEEDAEAALKVVEVASEKAEDEAKKARQERASAAAKAMWANRKAKKEASKVSLTEIVKKAPKKETGLGFSLELVRWTLEAEKGLLALVDSLSVEGEKRPETAREILASILGSMK